MKTNGRMHTHAMYPCRRQGASTLRHIDGV